MSKRTFPAAAEGLPTRKDLIDLSDQLSYLFIDIDKARYMATMLEDLIQQTLFPGIHPNPSKPRSFHIEDETRDLVGFASGDVTDRLRDLTERFDPIENRIKEWLGHARAA